MSSIYINGIGLIDRIDFIKNKTLKEIDNLNFANDEKVIKYDSVFEKSELRRISKYSKLAIEVSARSLIDAGFKDFRNKNNEETAIVFTTGLGASEMNIKFFRSVMKCEPDFCSPLTFASIVPNYSLGNVCISLGIKGYSTMLLGGNPFDIAEIVLHGGRAEDMIVGSEEEYCSDFFESISSLRVPHNVPLSEGTAAFYLSLEKKENTYCELISSSSCTLEKNPLFFENSFECAKIDIFDTINECVDKDSISAVFGIGDDTTFGKCEKELLENIFCSAEHHYDSKKLFGETLGSSFCMNIALACIRMKDENIKGNTLVTGTDIHGNYMCIVLKR